MPVLTLLDVKALLQIPDTSKDTLIQTLIPLVEDKIVDYCRNSFLDYGIQVATDTIAFVNANPPRITDSASGFLTALFAAGDDIQVSGSFYNNGRYRIASVLAGTITLTTDKTLVDEEAGQATILVTKIKWPQTIKIDAARLINYNLTNQGKMVSSESLPGGYQVAFLTDAEIMTPFNRFRKPFK